MGERMGNFDRKVLEALRSEPANSYVVANRMWGTKTRRPPTARVLAALKRLKAAGMARDDFPTPYAVQRRWGAVEPGP